MKPGEILAEVAQQVSECTRCQLHYSRKKAVPGEGAEDAKILFIGEGPGFYENEQGRPFVGQAGQFLDELLQQAGLRREEVFITNVVKCRPPGNRDPQNEELLACSAYLQSQLEAINPKIVVTLGRFSMARFLPNARISDVHGQATWVRSQLVVPMFHPAAALHQPSLRSTVEADFARLPEYISQAMHARPELISAAAAELRAASERLPEEPAVADDEPAKPKSLPTQLSLF